MAVAVQQGDTVSCGGHDSGVHGAALAGIFCELDDADVGSRGDGGEGAIGAFIIHKDDFVGDACHGGADFFGERCDVVLFVKERDDDGNHGERVRCAGVRRMRANALFA